MITQQVVHYLLHFLYPLGVALFFYRRTWKKSYLILVLTMLVDLDHLLANPVFDPNRCGIGFHPLHSFIAIGCYFLFLLHPKTRIVGIGLLLHMFTDAIDCYWNAHPT
jgi:phosphatidylglycerophosphate synthase